jgi:hypothetical protein
LQLPEKPFAGTGRCVAAQSRLRIVHIGVEAQLSSPGCVHQPSPQHSPPSLSQYSS